MGRPDHSRRSGVTVGSDRPTRVRRSRTPGYRRTENYCGGSSCRSPGPHDQSCSLGSPCRTPPHGPQPHPTPSCTPTPDGLPRRFSHSPLPRTHGTSYTPSRPGRSRRLWGVGESSNRHHRTQARRTRCPWMNTLTPNPTFEIRGLGELPRPEQTPTGEETSGVGRRSAPETK